MPNFSLEPEAEDISVVAVPGDHKMLYSIAISLKNISYNLSEIKYTLQNMNERDSYR